MSQPQAATDDRPWYRYPWPWLLMIPPAASIVFWVSVVTTMAGPPSLVVDDYAKIGLVYAEERSRDRRAAELGVVARLHWVRDTGSVTLAVTELDDPPERMALLLAHPTRQRSDLRTVVRRDSAGVYRGRLPSDAPTPRGRRYVQLAPVGTDAGDWRLTGELAADQSELTLRAEAGATAAR